MKTVQLRINMPFNSREVFTNSVKINPKGLDIEEMRRRVRVLAALESLPSDATELKLEDADHETLKKAINETPWAIADAGLLQIIDDVLGAKAAQS